MTRDTTRAAYDAVPSGLLSTTMDGHIVLANSTLLAWIGRTRDEVVDTLRFVDLLTVGGKLYHETHFAPLIRMHGEVSGVAFELKRADGGRMPVLVSSIVQYDGAGTPVLIRTTIFDAQLRRAYEEELLRERQAAEAAQARLEDALAVLQQSLLPATIPAVPGLAVAAGYHTASPDDLGGDFYDLFAIERERWCFFLGDVAGKGPAAAAVTSLARYTLRAAAMHDPSAALSTLNALLYERFVKGDPRYCTAVFGILRHDPSTGQVAVQFASGGHPPPLLIRADGSTAYVPSVDGTLIGILPDSKFPPTDLTLDPGDLLLLYTDGLIEARVGGGRDLYGPEAVQELAARHAGSTPEALVTALSAVLAGFGPHLADDTALLAFGPPKT